MRHAVILAGGGGTRLWPASRRRRPKQLLPLGAREGETLLAATARRLALPAERILVVTARELAADVARALPGTKVIGEPAARNTAAAIGWAAVELLRADPDAVMGVLPADHHVGDETKFRAVIDEAFALAEARDAIVTIGLTPTRAETGFGYLQLGATVGGAREVVRFVEKPARAAAEQFFRSGDTLWNGGMFFFRAARMLSEIRAHLPALSAGLDRIAAGASVDEVYPALPSISIDHGVMEKTRGILTLPGDFGWNDVGAWPALAEVRAADAAGNVTSGEVIAHDARGNIVVAEPGKLVAVVGLEGMVVVQTADAVLVMPRERAQDVKAIVEELARRKLDTFL